MHSLLTRGWVEVDLGALLRNGALVVEHTGARLLPMVKADAYGLGATRVACALEELDPWGFGVATVTEGDELRRAGIERPIVVFTPLLIEEFDAARRARLTPTLGSADAIAAWRHSGLPWHLAIDTGMNRAGVSWHDVGSIHTAIASSPPQGVFTHFHSAQLNDGSRRTQEERFAQVLAALPVQPKMVHAENSPAIAPDPVVALRARVVDVRVIDVGDTVSYDATYRADSRRRIATLALGYADGYRRALSNIGIALVRGKRARVVGVVTMDMTMIDVTNIACDLGDIATLIGRDGDDQLSVAEVAATGRLSPYELLTGLRSRLPRRFVTDGSPNEQR